MITSDFINIVAIMAAVSWVITSVQMMYKAEPLDRSSLKFIIVSTVLVAAMFYLAHQPVVPTNSLAMIAQVPLWTQVGFVSVKLTLFASIFTYFFTSKKPVAESRRCFRWMVGISSLTLTALVINLIV